MSELWTQLYLTSKLPTKFFLLPLEKFQKFAFLFSTSITELSCFWIWSSILYCKLLIYLSLQLNFTIAVSFLKSPISKLGQHQQPTHIDSSLLKALTVGESEMALLDFSCRYHFLRHKNQKIFHACWKKISVETAVISSYQFTKPTTLYLCRES